MFLLLKASLSPLLVEAPLFCCPPTFSGSPVLSLLLDACSVFIAHILNLLLAAPAQSIQT